MKTIAIIGAGKHHFQPKWVNTTNTQPYMPSQKTPVENFFLAGSHTQTQAQVWSLETFPVLTPFAVVVYRKE